MMMNGEQNKCIVSIKYSILDTSNEATTTKTEIERVFVARNKSAILKKIDLFEKRLRKKKTKRSFMARKLDYLQHFLQSWRYTYDSMLKI